MVLMGVAPGGQKLTTITMWLDGEQGRGKTLVLSVFISELLGRYQPTNQNLLPFIISTENTVKGPLFQKCISYT